MSIVIVILIWIISIVTYIFLGVLVTKIIDEEDVLVVVIIWPLIMILIIVAFIADRMLFIINKLLNKKKDGN